MRLALLLLLVSQVANAQISIPAGTGDQMLSGMISMMGNFAQQFQNSQFGSLGGQMGTAPLTAAQMGSGMPLAGGMPAAGLMAMPGTGRTPNSALGGSGNVGNVGNGSLDGAWRSNNGEYLLIEGQRFRLHSTAQRYIDGRIAQRGDVVGFLYPQRRTALLYHYQIRGNRLALLGQDGRMMGYQRVRSGH